MYEVRRKYICYGTVPCEGYYVYHVYNKSLDWTEWMTADEYADFKATIVKELFPSDNGVHKS